MDDWDEKFRKYYQKHKANYGDSQMKQRFRRVIRWREHRAEYLDRKMETENTALWHYQAPFSFVRRSGLDFFSTT